MGLCHWKQYFSCFWCLPQQLLLENTHVIYPPKCDHAFRPPELYSMWIYIFTDTVADVYWCTLLPNPWGFGPKAQNYIWIPGVFISPSFTWPCIIKNVKKQNHTLKWHFNEKYSLAYKYSVNACQSFFTIPMYILSAYSMYVVFIQLFITLFVCLSFRVEEFQSLTIVGSNGVSEQSLGDLKKVRIDLFSCQL